MDGLFLHVMLNRRTPGAQEDVQLLESILGDPEIADAQHEGKLALDAVTMMCKVAKEAVEQSHGSTGRQRRGVRKHISIGQHMLTFICEIS